MHARSILRVLLLSCLFLSAALRPAGAAIAPDEQKKRTKEIEAFVRVDLGKLDAELAKPEPHIAVRDLSHAALAYLILGEGADKGAAKAEALLRRIFALQPMDPEAPNYGDVPWSPDNPNIHDENAIEFTTSAWTPVYIQFGDRFSKEFLDESEAHLRAAGMAVSKHAVRVAYTNISLMKAGNLILLGEYLKDAGLFSEGKALLDSWIDYTRENGIHEFDSPTYSQTQLGVLNMLYHNVKDAGIKAKTKVILDYFWADLSANFYAGSKSICGPNSRTYDFLTHDYNLSQVYYLNGIPAHISTERVYLNDQVQIWSAAVWNAYTPPDAQLALASEPARLIRQKYGPAPGEDRTNYITPDFAIGSSSHYYGGQDRQVVAALPSEKEIPFVSIVPDVLDAPYGKIKKLDKGGHSKIHHIEDATSAVQSMGAVLALLDSSKGVEQEPVTSVATNVLFPLEVDSVTLDGKPVAWPANGTLPVTPESVLCVRQGKGAIAARIFMAEAAPGEKPAFALKDDGKQWGAGRLIAYQYQGPEKKLSLHSLRSGVLLLARRCETDAEFDQFVKDAKAWKMEEKNEGPLWKVTAQEKSGQGGNTRLEASVDLKAKQSGPRLVNGNIYVSPILNINDVDWPEKIWPELPVAGVAGK